MTPREKISKQADEFALSQLNTVDIFEAISIFKKGAEYGYNLAVEKAVEWLCRNMVDTDYWCINAQALMSKPELIQNLKQAMKL